MQNDSKQYFNRQKLLFDIFRESLHTDRKWNTKTYSTKVRCYKYKLNYYNLNTKISLLSWIKTYRINNPIQAFTLYPFKFQQ